MADDSEKIFKVLVTSDDKSGKTRLGLNGQLFEVPHNKTVQLNGAQLEVLQNANVPHLTVKVVDDSADADGEVGMIQPLAPSGTAPESQQGPATPAEISAGTRAEGQPVRDPAPHTLNQDADRGGDNRPANITEANAQESLKQSAEDAGNPGDTPGNAEGDFDAEAFIAKNLDDADVSGLSAEQVEQVRKAENDREKPRKGMLDALDARAAELEAK